MKDIFHHYYYITIEEIKKKQPNIKYITFIALMADFVTDIILARDIGGFKSIMENNCSFKKKDGS